MSFEPGYLTGAPTIIRFSQDINPKKLVDLMFNAEDPFRLWGIEEEIGNSEFRVYAVDMHHGNQGNKLMFEITSSYMRVATPANSCVNTLLRLFSNLNHYVDAMAWMEVSDYELKVDLSRARFS